MILECEKALIFTWSYFFLIQVDVQDYRVPDNPELPFAPGQLPLSKQFHLFQENIHVKRKFIVSIASCEMWIFEK